MARKAPSKGRAKAKASAPSRKGPSAYERRIREYLRRHPGATRQEARGHKAREHVVRKSREIARLEAFAETQAAKFRGGDAEAILDALMVKYRSEGIGYLNRLQAEIERMNARYMAQKTRDKRGRRPSLGINMDRLSEVWTLPPETFGYH